MRRRTLLAGGLAAAALLGAAAHTPYGQWGVYRKRFLLMLTNRQDPASFALGRQVAEVLAEVLPESLARVSRAPHGERIASLISSKQLDLALMPPDEAAALKAGRPPFADYGPVALMSLVGVGDYLLVCRADFPAAHAFLVAGALSANRRRLTVPMVPGRKNTTAPDPRVPLHPGARLYFTGAPAPARRPAAPHDGGDH